MHLLARDKELHIFAHTKLKGIIDAHLEASDTDLCYPLFFHPLPYDSHEVLFEDNKIKVTTFPLDHGIPCNGFLFEEKIPKKKILPEKVNFYNIPVDRLGGIKNGDDFISNQGNIIKNSEITKDNRSPFSYAFCSDTKYNDGIIEYVKGVSLLYHETTFMEDRKERAILTNHSTTLDAGKIASKAAVKHLLIGHFSQRYRDEQLLLNETKTIFQKTILASQGLRINFSEL